MVRKVGGMNLTWETPPTTHRGPEAGKYVEVFETLRGRPGEWARLDTGLKSLASLSTPIKNGDLVGCEAGEFEATTRTVDGESRLYVRYVGTQADVVSIQGAAAV